MAASSSSTTTLALCSSFSSHCKISKISPSPPPLLSFSKPKLPSSLLFSTSRPPAFSFTPKYSASEAPAVLDSEPESPPKPAPVLEAAPEEEKPKREEIFAVVMIGSRQYIVFPGRYIYTQRLKGANVNDKVCLLFFPFCSSSRSVGLLFHLYSWDFRGLCSPGFKRDRWVVFLNLLAVNGDFLQVRCLSFVLVQIVLSKVLLVGTKTTTYIGKPVVTNAAVHAVVEEQGLNPKVIVFKYKKKKNYRRNIGHRQPNTRIRITGITGYEDYPAVTLDSLQS
ncbi:hypothetical protein Pint_07727 [Pistacia integerrima]|uniref:Uncharacterized protein n=1 Tax=Pistacia integerrima TaxID=434235 RepID=A0ACC0XZC3_9ROSI|nr:hypothetical protein Pint_07727 [Pistacia integerrima]